MKVITIDNIQDDIQATGEIRKFRKTIGSTQRATNPYNWWQATLVLLTYVDSKEGMGYQGIKEKIFETTGMEISNNSGQIFLAKAIDEIDPDDIRREYAKKLVVIAGLTGLKYKVDKTTAQQTHRKFFFTDRAYARNVLMCEFPELLPLFVEMDRFVQQFP